eukprot:TRINITY_DN24898_c0_g2_i1.p1 TRINITY_DN24898_c0_g2~~TRINITY_DN24898_c0_g2_i1.p1  ORF type:complete len:662 (+),score=88.72 TRINITY_DN24898_c0_g2_i1:114-2099(+)
MGSCISCYRRREEEESESWMKRAMGNIFFGNGGAARMAHCCSSKLLIPNRLQSMDVMVLDNSLRETEVGQLENHTVEDKKAIYAEVLKCGFNEIVVGLFKEHKTVFDVFVSDLVDSGADRSSLWAFSNITDKRFDHQKREWDTSLPIGLRKSRKYALYNLILEVDLNCERVTSLSLEDRDSALDRLIQMAVDRVEWVQEFLALPGHPAPRTLINLRDLCAAMSSNPDIVEKFVKGVARSDPGPWGLIMEEPSGGYLPCQVGSCIHEVRRWWKQAAGSELQNFLVHLHKGYGLAEACVLEALVQGATGIWCGICEEGAAVGHASSCLTLTNLARLGNCSVMERYKCSALRSAAQAVTRITTRQDPNPKTEIYGERATDWVFDMGMDSGKFDLADFFGEETHARITDLCSSNQIVHRMTECFGKDEFNQDLVGNMIELLHRGSLDDDRHEMMSPLGIGVLYKSAGGTWTASMKNMMASCFQATSTTSEIHNFWRQCAEPDGGFMAFESFYEIFMSRYFSCFKCDVTEACFKVLDDDRDGVIDFSEFEVWLQWTALGFPRDFASGRELVGLTFKRGLIPCMRSNLVWRMRKESEADVQLLAEEKILRKRQSTFARASQHMRRSFTLGQRDGSLNGQTGEKKAVQVQNGGWMLEDVMSPVPAGRH